MRVWSIAIYRGKSPHAMEPHPGAINPVLTRDHVTDCEAHFVADPFMVHEAGTWYMFFEVMESSGIGTIGLATSPDTLAWTYRQIVLREPFHLSYPHVFRWGDKYFMTPETLGVGAVRLYRADPFPFRWVPAADLIPGTFADPSVFRHRERWWMLACGTPWQHDSLRLFQSEHLTEGWSESPMSPLIENNSRIARPAGRVTPYAGGLIRFAQDCHPSYGAGVRAFSLHNFPSSFNENELPWPVLLPDPAGDWAALGMHHVDPHPTPFGEWIACVDGSRDYSL